MHRSRREFLAGVGRGMLISAVGYRAALEFGLATARAAEGGDDALTFGPLEPLVCQMQETPLDKLLAMLVDELHRGTELRRLVAAAALANARTFGGEDYIGFHTMMALAPALRMAGELPPGEQALPVLKVLFRNTSRIQAFGGRASEVLHPLAGGSPGAIASPGDAVRDAVRGKDVAVAERTLAAVATSPEAAFNALMHAVDDNTEVHRVVLPYRAFALLDVVGAEHAVTMLRQSIRYCVKSESRPHGAEYDRPREVLPKVLDQHHLLEHPLGTRVPEDAWVDAFSRTLFESTPEQAADAAGAALADGIAPDAICEAVSLAANQLLLRDAGRTEREVQPGKPQGSVHGDSIGVHASDSANAWRNIVRASDARNQAASTILASFQVAWDRVNRGGRFLEWQPRPRAEELAQVTAREPGALLQEVDAAIRANDQARAAALVHVYGEGGHPARAILDCLVRYAVSEDGALHAEKYYATASDEFAHARPCYRWRHLTALARVTASEYGTPAPGGADARALLSL